MIFELTRGPWFELSGGLWPSRGESWVDHKGVVVRVEQRSCETRAETILLVEQRSCETRAETIRDEARAERGSSRSAADEPQARSAMRRGLNR
jgi:hypothetical protein